jgi:hypothetical protein
VLSIQQGRGIDAPTNKTIEEQGGIATVIGATPSSARELWQFKGRTKRMDNKGQHIIILWSKTNATAESYL